MNQGNKFILAMVLGGDAIKGPYHLRNPFQQEPEFGVASVTYDLAELISQTIPPHATVAPPGGG